MQSILMAMDGCILRKRSLTCFILLTGDTYPIYNGAIGMTYEQAGGPQGGTASLINDGDTLTLKDRIIHHFTTSMSTIEVASLNAGKLISEFKNILMMRGNNGVGEI